VPPRTLFRNAASGNHPSIEPVGQRMRRWRATSYRRLIATYRSSCARRGPDWRASGPSLTFGIAHFSGAKGGIGTAMPVSHQDS